MFLVDSLPAGDDGVLDGPEGHHAASVRRLRVGEELVLADGRGGRVRCGIEAVEKDSLRLKTLERTYIEPPRPRVVVAQALVKGDRGELAVELATEAGVDAIVPWRASRCVARWDEGPRGAKALAKWRSTAREAAKQSRRAWVPEVAEPVTTMELAKLAGAAAKAMVLHESATGRLQDLPTDGDLLLVVGPEGGISEEELAAFAGVGAEPVRMGSSVLRTSTAGVAATAALLARTRWR